MRRFVKRFISFVFLKDIIVKIALLRLNCKYKLCKWKKIPKYVLIKTVLAMKESFNACSCGLKISVDFK